MTMTTTTDTRDRLARRRQNAWILPFLALALAVAVQPAALAAEEAVAAAVAQQTFKSPEAAAEAFVVASESFDVAALTEILGSAGVDLVASEDPVQDRNQAQAFAAAAREKMVVSRDPEDRERALIVVGAEDWPLPIPIVKMRGGWRFDTEAGRQEILQRRIGGNELDAIEICHGYVEAQHEYALVKRDGALVNQYAQRIVSTPGRQDGLAWQADDGSWQGPVGEAIARVIAEGYVAQPTPYHGYYFKVLTGQGPAAPLGELDFVIDGAMIGGFALVAAPADYGVTGVKTFIVSHDGVVYEQDLGPDTLEQFWAMERFNPDQDWQPVLQD
jgi:hypothetical protein